MILSLIVFASPIMLSFGNIAPLSSSHTFVPFYLPPLSWNLFLDKLHIPFTVASDPPIDFSVQPLDIFYTSLRSPSNEQVEDEPPNPKLGSPTPAPPENLT